MRLFITYYQISYFGQLLREWRLCILIGVITNFSEQTKSLEELILIVDRALYRSKDEGRNRVSTETLK